MTPLGPFNVAFAPRRPSQVNSLKAAGSLVGSVASTYGPSFTANFVGRALLHLLL